MFSKSIYSYGKMLNTLDMPLSDFKRKEANFHDLCFWNALILEVISKTEGGLGKSTDTPERSQRDSGMISHAHKYTHDNSILSYMIIQGLCL